MTASAFADLVHAQRISEGLWKGCCPAHNDRSPSLGIREGDDGRILVLCRAGCTLDSILTALKLSKGDLFAGLPPSAQQFAVIRAARKARNEAVRAERKARLAALDRVEKLQAVVNALGEKLVRLSDGDVRSAELARLFHVAIGRLHQATTEADRFYLMRPKGAKDKDDALGHND